MSSFNIRIQARKPLTIGRYGFDICLELTWTQAVSHTVMAHSLYTKCVIFLRVGLCMNRLQTELKIKCDIIKYIQKTNDTKLLSNSSYSAASTKTKQNKVQSRQKTRLLKQTKRRMIHFPTIMSAIDVYQTSYRISNFASSNGWLKKSSSKL